MFCTDLLVKFAGKSKAERDYFDYFIFVLGFLFLYYETITTHTLNRNKRTTQLQETQLRNPYRTINTHMT